MVAAEGSSLLLLLNLPALGNEQKGSECMNDTCLHRQLTLGRNLVDKMSL